MDRQTLEPGERNLPAWGSRSLDTLSRTRTALLTTAALLNGLIGCNGETRGTHQPNAPTLGEGDSAARRDVADPNAPFLLKPSEPLLANRASVLDVSGLARCAPEQLGVFESRARINGARHTLRLSLSNTGQACRLSGYPAISLLDPTERVLSAVVVQRVTPEAMTAFLVNAQLATEANGGSTPDIPAGVPSPQVLVGQTRQAAFEIGWTDGPACIAVTRIAIGAPGSASSTAPPIVINRPLRLCDGRILLTAVAPENGEQ